ncbi:MAG TPA: hypothetical protein VFX29_05285 [Longimicrobiaceae bacterium]|nr:hypothetical protein [Longimicrobiaceae bacterium]
MATRFSPGVLPQEVDWGGILSQGINSFRQARAGQRDLERQKKQDQRLETQDARAAELHTLQTAAMRDQQLASRAQLLSTPGVYTDDNVARVDGPAPTIVHQGGGIAGQAPRPTVSSARHAGQLAGVGNVYVDPDAQRRQLEAMLVQHGVAQPEAELRAATGKVDTAIDPRRWEPTTQEEAVNYYAATQGDVSGRMKLESVTHQNRLAQLDREYKLRGEQIEKEAEAGNRRYNAEAGKTARDKNFEERRKTFAGTLFPNGIANAFHQELVDALAGGESPEFILQSMRADKVPPAMLAEAEKILSSSRTKRLLGAR